MKRSARILTSPPSSPQFKEEVVVRLLKDRRISQGKASELLGISRYDLLDLMARYDIPVTDLFPEEMAQEFAQSDKLFRRPKT